MLELKKKADEKFKSREYFEAINIYLQALETDEENDETRAIILSNCSFACFKTEQFQRGIDMAKKAIEVNPQYPKSYYRLGQNLFGIQDFKGSL